MKKVLITLSVFLSLVSYAIAGGYGCKGNNELKIFLDKDGRVTELSWNNCPIYQLDPKNTLYVDPFVVGLPGKECFPTGLDVGTHVTITINGIDTYMYKMAITSNKTKYEIIPVFMGATEVAIKAAGVPPEAKLLTCSFILDESGRTYQIQINRSVAADTKDAGKPIFSVSLQTKARYYLGSHVGVFRPFNKSTEYSLGFTGPNDQEATIMENKLRNVLMVFLGSIYPFGFEPEGGAISYRRVQIILGTELSSSIFKKIYFGPGYDFTYFSICILFRYGAVQELQNGFSVGDPVENTIKSVPTVTKNKLNWGLTLCLPVDLMTGWLGKQLGIK